MLKLYYASAIDMCVEEAFKQIEEFRKLFKKYQYQDITDIFETIESAAKQVNHPIQVFGAGFNQSPIIGPDSSPVYKGAVTAYDLRLIRNCDILLVVTDLKQFCAGTMMELEYARNLGIYTIILCLSDKGCTNCEKANECSLGSLAEKKCPIYHTNGMVKNIFLETYANKIIYSMVELEDILKDLTQ